MSDIKDYPALTIEDLEALCKEQIKNGNGKKKILISSDDEGSGFHGLFYAFTTSQEKIEKYKELYEFTDDVDSDKIVLLG